METNRSPDPRREQLHEVERGESAAWVVYPPTPAWWAVAVGLWAGGLALTIGLLDGAVQAITQLGLVLVMLLGMRWDRRRRGTYPAGRPPREITPAIVRMVVGALVVSGLAWLTGELTSIWAAAAIAAAGAWAVVARYEHEYALLAARVRGRLG